MAGYLRINEIMYITSCKAKICYVCGKKSMGASNHRRHTEKHFPRPKKYACRICAHRYLRSDSHKRHMEGKHPEYKRSAFPFIRLGQINLDPVEEVTEMEGTTLTIPDENMVEEASTSQSSADEQPTVSEDTTSETTEQPLADFWEGLLNFDFAGNQTKKDDITKAMEAAGLPTRDELQDYPLD